jgi:WD40 repeat protein
MDTDAENNFLVTGSEDKTIRVWKLPSGEAIRVIRPPIGKGKDGMVTALAVSPDGRTIAAGMYSPDIYLFDLQTGTLTKHVTRLKTFAHRLKYSPDGRYLAALLFSGETVVFDTRGYEPIAADGACKVESFGLAFDSLDKVTTACGDGFIREYEVSKDASLHLLAQVKGTSGNQPVIAASSPDGAQIAIGFSDTAKIDVLSSKDLSFLYSPDEAGITGRFTSGLSWSADGRFLYGAGGWAVNSVFRVRVWSDSGRGAYTDISASKNGIASILPLRNGGIAFASLPSSSPSFGIVDAKGNRTLQVETAIAEYRGNPKGLLLSPDGATVQFGYEAAGKAAARFSIADRQLDATPAGTGTLKPATVDTLPITDWMNSRSPKLSGKPLPFSTNGLSLSLAITPDRDGFVLGALSYLYFYNADGTPRFQVETTAINWCVNMSADGRFVVDALGDGTIRWVRGSDGKELLDFFPAKDRKRWVMWTPSGYYDASPGGDDLIGWQVNNGRDHAADFFPVGQFRSTYYRPDIIAKILETGDESKAILAANEESGRKAREASVAQMLPPVVEILSPADGADLTTPNLTVRYAVRMPSGQPLTDVKVLVDGRPASAERGASPETRSPNGDVLESSVSVPSKDVTVSVIAMNRYAASAPATIHLHWSGTNTDSSGFKPDLYVLAIGVSRYSEPSLQLRYAAKDAQDFAAALEHQKGGLYRDVQVKVLTDDKANRDDVLDGLDWIRKATKNRDVAMILLSGHGVNDQSGKYFFLPHDANMDSLLRTGVSMSDIQTTISSLAGKTLFFVDTCHSGNVLGARKSDRTDINGLMNELASAENGAVVFAASTGTQSSIEDPAWLNGAFTKALVEGINGRADYGDSDQITMIMLELYVSQRVKQLTQGQQTPMTQKPDMISDYPVALKQ